MQCILHCVHNGMHCGLGDCNYGKPTSWSLIENNSELAKL